METSLDGYRDHLSGRYSDPTYEAWKPMIAFLRPERFAYSDPTYEAWKHQDVWLIARKDGTLRSYL